jgi:hypothetical protein
VPRPIAMWSGPRNISTAMMYSFGNRPDCEAWDEPFYAFSLKTHGNDHPLRDEIIAAYETDHARLVARCLAPAPSGRPVFYQKHMTHHMLAGFDRSWILGLSNAFLVRDPIRVLRSYVKKWEDVSLRDIGFIEQREIFDLVSDRLGVAPPVVDADDVLADPRTALEALCGALAIPFDEAMLRWPAGPKPFDGNWASHWYNAAWKSEGFAPQEERGPSTALPAHLQRIADAARPIYEALKSASITGNGKSRRS